MKKFLSIVLMILLVMFPVISVDAATTKSTSTTTTKKTTTKKTTTKKTTTTTTKETVKEGSKIKIHVFYSSTCGYCKALHEFLDELSKDSTYGSMFEVVDYEVSNSDNSELKTEVDTYYDHAGNTGVPVYIIGNQYFDGYGASYNDRIKSAIKEAYESGKTFDAVEKLAAKLNKDNNVVGYVILAGVAVMIIAVIISSSKNRYYEDETDEVEAKEEKTTDVKKVETESKAEEKTTKKTKTSSATKKKNSTKKSKK